MRLPQDPFSNGGSLHLFVSAISALGDREKFRGEKKMKHCPPQRTGNLGGKDKALS